MNWFIHVWNSVTGHKHIEKGVKVKTPWGMGKVTGGCIHIDLDGHHPNAHENDHHVTLELHKVTF